MIYIQAHKLDKFVYLKNDKLDKFVYQINVLDQMEKCIEFKTKN